MRRIKVSKNWVNGRYEGRTLFRHKVMYPSYLHLDRNHLYMSHKGQILQHDRRKGTVMLEDNPKHVTGGVDTSDVTCFTRKNDILFGGRDNGNMFLYENGDTTEERTSTELLAHSPVVAADFADSVFVTATKEELRVWHRYMELDRSVLEPMAEFEDEYKSASVSPDGRRLGCGKYRDRSREALQLIDLET